MSFRTCLGPAKTTSLLAWDGGGVSDEGFIVEDGKLAYDKIPGITVLSEPSLVTVQGEKAQITIGSPGTDFLEPVPGQQGIFRAVHIDEGPTVALACLVQPKESGYLEVTLQFDITRLTRREPLEGVDLDVGRPVFAKQQISGTTLLHAGHWLVHRLYVTEDVDECIVFLLRVEHYPSQEGA